MATNLEKKKKFSFSTILTIVLAVLPQLLEVLNDGAQTAHIVLDNYGPNTRLQAHVISVSSDGSISASANNARTT